jgi:hypothetical protein
MENNLSSLIDSAGSVLILLPTKPYFDQVAAGLALYLSLKTSKETAIICPSPMLVEFNRLVGVDKITSEAGNKNLTLKFSGYPAENVERVSADVETGKFYLTIIPKQGLPSPKKEEIEFAYSGVAADLIILVGGANESHFPFLADPDVQGVKIVHLGTKELSAPAQLGIMSQAHPASSISEIVAGVINQSGRALDADIATNLVLGMEEGSNHFSSEETTPETFELFAQLLRSGGQRFTRRPIENKRPTPFVQPTPPLQPNQPAVQPKNQAPKDWLEPKIYKGTSVS